MYCMINVGPCTNTPDEYFQWTTIPFTLTKNATSIVSVDSVVHGYLGRTEWSTNVSLEHLSKTIFAHIRNEDKTEIDLLIDRY